MKGFRFKLALAGALGAFAFIAGSGLTISSGWLITMASKQPPILTLSVSIVAVRFFGISRSVLIYQGWTYWVFRKRVSASQISYPERGALDTASHILHQ